MFPISIINAPASNMVGKLQKLYDLLQTGKQNFEKMALKFENIQLRRTIIVLAQESNQYASELSSQIYCLGGNLQKEHQADDLPDTKEFSTSSDEETINEVCEIGERELIYSYDELLNEPSLKNGLRKMIEYQMESFKYIISQLRLLQTSLHK